MNIIKYLNFLVSPMLQDFRGADEDLVDLTLTQAREVAGRRGSELRLLPLPFYLHLGSLSLARVIIFGGPGDRLVVQQVSEITNRIGEVHYSFVDAEKCLTCDTSEMLTQSVVDR